MKTSQSTRNIYKFVRRQATGIKGRMVTDDYGNKLSVKKKSDGSFGRRHTLSQGKKRADGLNYEDKLYNTRKKSETGHAASERRRSNTGDHLDKTSYHRARASSHPNAKKLATFRAKEIHGAKRKSKDFVK